jgi:hypothetical protein
MVFFEVVKECLFIAKVKVILQVIVTSTRRRVELLNLENFQLVQKGFSIVNFHIGSFELSLLGRRQNLSEKL